MATTKIIFNKNFDTPDRISGNKKSLKELGITVLGKKAKYSGWDYEFAKIKMDKII